MISFSHIDKSFPTPSGDIAILKDMYWEVKSWDFVALMWPSGAGKSTILNLIAGLESSQSWNLLVQDTDITDLTIDQKTIFRWKYISFVFQQFHLLPQLTVQENIDLVVELNDLERRFSTSEILHKVWLSGREKDYPSTLSGWEQQRVAVARAFVADTPILLADEPTGNLDQASAQGVMDLMTSLHEEVNNTIVMITHDQGIASYADRIFMLQDFGVFKQ
jgi:putative ABC transport system ATP-binding protein